MVEETVYTNNLLCFVGEENARGNYRNDGGGARAPVSGGSARGKMKTRRFH